MIENHNNNNNTSVKRSLSAGATRRGQVRQGSARKRPDRRTAPAQYMPTIDEIAESPRSSSSLVVTLLAPDLKRCNAKREPKIGKALVKMPSSDAMSLSHEMSPQEGARSPLLHPQVDNANPRFSFEYKKPTKGHWHTRSNSSGMSDKLSAVVTRRSWDPFANIDWEYNPLEVGIKKPASVHVPEPVPVPTPWLSSKDSRLFPTFSRYVSFLTAWIPAKIRFLVSKPLHPVTRRPVITRGALIGLSVFPGFV